MGVQHFCSLNDAKFTYDETGNILTSELHNQTYAYNAEGRLATVSDAKKVLDTH